MSMGTEKMKCFLAQCFAAGMKQQGANPKEKSEGKVCCPRIRAGVQGAGGKGREGIGKFPTVTAPSAGRARWSRVFAGSSCLCPDLAPLWGRPKNSLTVQPGSKVEAPAPLRSQ